LQRGGQSHQVVEDPRMARIQAIAAEGFRLAEIQTAATRMISTLAAKEQQAHSSDSRRRITYAIYPRLVFSEDLAQF
jgi:hypothetical protein